VLYECYRQPAGDIAISGLGWFTIGKANVIEEVTTEDSVDSATRRGGDEDDSSDLYNEDEEIVLVLHLPRAVEMFVRPSIPLGKKAANWYEYVDLTDKEVNERPQVFY
jgi:nitric-oxide synthase